ncbi:TlpA family protein disulfide reductase [Actinophytocola algeriensis]|uniref:Thioredoxin domain-containing protein n=1 Tax=Actinophytocola algeriensis TaxID=1768010 RepID=A0A7W7QE84_9PSEU|nr:hypothetical protein [Actinophytocola algeriensis]MBB4911674.1 hypothetical protein [Actinophytocola algeriensis]MBE1473338.1 hypothetical protein [Actinophytocola algeriensis]
MSFQTSALIVTWVALLLLAFVVAGLVRQVHALSSGAGARPVRGGLRAGDEANLAGLGVTGPAVLLFLTATCHTCVEALAETVAVAGNRAVLALYEGQVPATPPGVTAFGDKGHLFAEYGALATPYAVVVGADGRITATAPVGSRAAVRELIDPVMEVQ